ncbi:TetR/AcrR family transcriptional regulator [Sulfitobacter pseudonitzschiae]|uniref:TetR/AcrR family transcriptional regulator n=1 Tax=Pseudosulfitobacter pseudonitzschiae TaxID=1402135 RepID=A0A9Q2S1Y7_9RHOB|nr:TetR/AcrR family transcriptional regulator [Pseudosulfitobacter pseudonitzschiae]MBM2294060.1 TetR/AcrR family transcriptional regulator [Pseudosulfitobacter pseudonitzschiae]MBM2298984.1 TetR/AcrR family transcriptional regulator [Pseudosulfitobacter pseudonitzschiae]MBM2303892.1 TetR/AcrR family transcriptional regulator [Pseudosulfitobacter pseudonitzschiae]MBM2313674.1 TetR/AcrR family transcriptional regulator [Pseudosulfitobacter pseudonitzschiae]MBM2318588.1 TetR/AcrR family transcri
MGRKPSISREDLLGEAEEIVRTGGAAALTIGALAQAAGISKGGVQYSFASKDDLVRGLIDRWTGQFDALLGETAPDDPVAFVRRYIAATRTSQQAMNAKMAGLLVSYLENPVNRRETHDWYRGIFDRLEGNSQAAQAARVAFLAVEGLFLMHMNGIDEDGDWVGFLDDVEAVFERLAC